ncbi:hypothetical protein [Pedobacter immunditicola]|uniref:hypothetical protein n=1 Tax=Pedobacter immunditicola TaxID=3133440 RepID=UPI00309DB0E1
MKKRYNINTLEELQAQIFTLKTGYTVQGELLKENTKMYFKQYAPSALIRKYITPNNILKADEKTNFSSKLMAFVLPVIMNTTLFRGSGFMTKALVGLATSKIGKSLDAEHIATFVSSVKNWINKPKKTTKSGMQVDYGIPPDSETY